MSMDLCFKLKLPLMHIKHQWQSFCPFIPTECCYLILRSAWKVKLIRGLIKSLWQAHCSGSCKLEETPVQECVALYSQKSSLWGRMPPPINEKQSTKVWSEITQISTVTLSMIQSLGVSALYLDRDFLRNFELISFWLKQSVIQQTTTLILEVFFLYCDF